MSSVKVSVILSILLMLSLSLNQTLRLSSFPAKLKASHPNRPTISPPLRHVPDAREALCASAGIRTSELMTVWQALLPLSQLLTAAPRK